MLVGIGAQLITAEAEVVVGPGVRASFEILGLTEVAVKETRVRVRSALDQMGFELGARRVSVRLLPGDVRKTGAGYDLAIAVAILAAAGEVPTDRLRDTLLVGELSLTGTVRSVRGTLPCVLHARNEGLTAAVVPLDNGAEGAIVRGIDVQPARTIRDVVEYLSGGKPQFAPYAACAVSSPEFDLSEIRGQAVPKRALEIAAAGYHNILFIGPPGGGKTMLARALPSLLPPLTESQAIETTSIHSVAGLLRPGTALLADRPIRAPHHTASTVGMIGGGDPARPGETALAHNGVLFLDELPEFPRDTIEHLREPLNEGAVTIVRNRERITFPSRFMLVAAMNPCPCGYRGEPDDRCSCSVERVAQWLTRVKYSPIFDKFDLCVRVPRVRASDLCEPAADRVNAGIRERVKAARAVAFHGRGTSTALSWFRPEARGIIAGIPNGTNAMSTARVARTIADLDGSDVVEERHVEEAISFRWTGWTGSTIK